jgi:anti-anti-sigma regulatory factor
MAKSSVKKSTAKKSAAKKKVTRKATVKKGSVKKKAVKKNNATAVKPTAKAGNKITLNAVLAINDAKALYAEFGKALQTKKNIAIDASAVEMVDTAILQLLLAFTQKIQLQNIGLTWVKPSKEFLSRSETLNLTDALGLREA